MEAVKSKLTNRIILIASLLFLMGSCAFAQIERMFTDSTKTVIKRYSANPLFLKNPMIGDDIQLNAFSDSLDNKTITFAIFIFFPENINYKGKDIVVTFTDGTFEIFQQATLDEESGYASYETPYDINGVSKKEVDSILIRGVAKYKIKNKSFFKDFFAAL